MEWYWVALIVIPTVALIIAVTFYWDNHEVIDTTEYVDLTNTPED